MKTVFRHSIIRTLFLFFPVFSLFVLMLLFGAGCSQKKTEIPAGQALYGGTLKLKIVEPVETLDPSRIIFYTDWNVAALIYEGLVKYGKDPNTVEPLLAENWEKLDGGRRWIFTLRRGIHFQDDPCFSGGKGREVTAEDVLYTFRRIANPEDTSPNWYMFSGKIIGLDNFHSGQTANITGIRVLNSHRIEFRLIRPYVSFLKLLATTSASIVPREAVEMYRKDFCWHPVGTGPFILARWKPMSELVLVRNTHYWRKTADGQSLPFLDAIQFLIKSNFSLTASEFLKGEVDVLSVSESEYAQLSKGKNFTSKYTTQKYFGKLGSRFLGFSLNGNSPLSKDVNLRRALSLGFHREELKQDLPGRYFRFANSLVPPLLLNNATLPEPTYDPERAGQLIRQSKYARFSRSLTLCSNLSTPALLLFKRNAEKLGLSMELNIHDIQYYQYIIRNRPDIFRISFIPSYPDPEEYYTLFYSRSGPDINLTGYSNPEFDRVLELAFFEQNERKRQRLFLQLEDILQRDVPAIYLFHRDPDLIVTPRFIHGIKSGFLIMDYSEVWMDRK